MSNKREKLNIWLRSNKLILAVLIVLGLTIVLTWISMWIYHVNDVSRLDVSRPGYESVRKSIERQEDPDVFQPTGKLDKKAFEVFQKEFGSKRKLLDGNNRFDPEVISDEQLRLSPTTENENVEE